MGEKDRERAKEREGGGGGAHTHTHALNVSVTTCIVHDRPGPILICGFDLAKANRSAWRKREGTLSLLCRTHVSGATIDYCNSIGIMDRDILYEPHEPIHGHCEYTPSPPHLTHPPTPRPATTHPCYRSGILIIDKVMWRMYDDNSIDKLYKKIKPALLAMMPSAPEKAKRL